MTRRTTVVVLGDGRDNGKTQHAGLRGDRPAGPRALWLTPEPRYSWRLGSCDLPGYAEFCDRVDVVRDLTGLEHAAQSSPPKPWGGDDRRIRAGTSIPAAEYRVTTGWNTVPAQLGKSRYEPAGSYAGPHGVTRVTFGAPGHVPGEAGLWRNWTRGVGRRRRCTPR